MNYLAGWLNSEFPEIWEISTELNCLHDVSHTSPQTLREEISYFKNGVKAARSQLEAISANAEDIAKDMSYFNRLTVKKKT